MMARGNEPAFPTPNTLVMGGVGHDIRSAGGLTKRELFAAMAMQGFISGCYAGNNAGFTVHGNCFAAVEYADALIAELEKEK